MDSILESLFYGNIRPDESIHPKHSEYHELNLKISSLINAMYSAAAYTEGFRLGALMMIEVVVAKN